MMISSAASTVTHPSRLHLQGTIGHNQASLTVVESEDRVTIEGQVGDVELELQQRQGPGYQSILGFLEQDGVSWPVSLRVVEVAQDYTAVEGLVAQQPISMTNRAGHLSGYIGYSQVDAHYQNDSATSLSGQVRSAYHCHDIALTGTAEGDVPLEGLLPALGMVFPTGS